MVVDRDADLQETFLHFRGLQQRLCTILRDGAATAATPSEGKPTYKQVHQIPSSLVLNVKL